MIKKIIYGAMMSFVAVFTVSSLTLDYAGAQSQVQVKQGFGANNAQNVGLGGTKNADAGDGGLLLIVQNFINFVLGLLSFIALIMLLRGGFQMVTAAGDDAKYNSGFTILKQAGVGIAIIGLSWMIVSFVFFALGSIGATPQS